MLEILGSRFLLRKIVGPTTPLNMNELRKLFTLTMHYISADTTSAISEMRPKIATRLTNFPLGLCLVYDWTGC